MLAVILNQFYLCLPYRISYIPNSREKCDSPDMLAFPYYTHHYILNLKRTHRRPLYKFFDNHRGATYLDGCVNADLSGMRTH